MNIRELRFRVISLRDYETAGNGCCGASDWRRDLCSIHHRRGQVVEVEQGTGVHCHHMLNTVLELADVAWPVVRHQKAKSFRSDLEMTTVAAQKMLYQFGKVLDSLPKGRNAESDYFQSEEQVPTKRAALYIGSEVPVRSSDD